MGVGILCDSSKLQAERGFCEHAAEREHFFFASEERGAKKKNYGAWMGVSVYARLVLCPALIFASFVFPRLFLSPNIINNNSNGGVNKQQQNDAPRPTS